MALTERALKRHKVAVITIEAPRDSIPQGTGSVEFEWFNNAEAAEEFMTGWNQFAEDDSNTYTLLDGEDGEVAMAYLTILITDTESMEVHGVTVFPVTPSTEEWKDQILSDLTVLYDKPEAKPKKKVVVKGRKRGVVVGKTERGEAPEEDEAEEAPKPAARRPRKIAVKATAEDDE